MKKSEVSFDRKKNEFVNLSDQLINTFVAQYPGLDVKEHIDKMKEWLTTNPKGKRYSGSIGFIRKWLGTSYANMKKQEKAVEVFDSYVPDAMEGYLSDLWKGKKDLLDLNSK